MNLQDAKIFMHEWGISENTTVWDNNEREHSLDCLLEMYAQQQVKNLNIPAVKKSVCYKCDYEVVGIGRFRCKKCGYEYSR